LVGVLIGDRDRDHFGTGYDGQDLEGTISPVPWLEEAIGPLTVPAKPDECDRTDDHRFLPPAPAKLAEHAVITGSDEHAGLGRW
jgi:hypothetical protein